MASVQGTGAVAAGAEESETSLETRAHQLIDTIVRPLIEADGGRIEIVQVTEARLLVRLTGNCSGCPGRPYTLRGVVEKAARKYLLPDIQVTTEEGD